jgi:hypothetical protein
VTDGEACFFVLIAVIRANTKCNHVKNERGPGFRQSLSMTARAMPGIRPNRISFLWRRRVAPAFSRTLLHDLALTHNVQIFDLDFLYHPQADEPKHRQKFHVLRQRARDRRGRSSCASCRHETIRGPAPS